jgi:hypothetical protein
MSGSAAGGDRFLCLALLAALAACSKSSGDPQPLNLSKNGTRVVPGAPAVRPQAAESPTQDPFAEDAGVFDPGTPGQPLVTQVTERIDATAFRVDPDDAVVQAARASGGSCYAGLQEGPEVRGATLSVTVVPGGSVSRTEVFGESDPGVVDCLRRVGDGLHFSSKDDAPSAKENAAASIRSFSIDIRVARAH